MNVNEEIKFRYNDNTVLFKDFKEMILFAYHFNSYYKSLLYKTMDEQGRSEYIDMIRKMFNEQGGQDGKM